MGRKKQGKQKRRARKRMVPQSGPMMSFWVVAFLDLLGYRSVLGKFDAFPPPTESNGRHHVENSLARAIHLRRRLIREVKSFIESISEAPDLSNVPPQAHSTVGSWHKARLIQSPGPDHMILACSLQPDAGHFPLRGVYNLVGAAAAAMLIQLSLGADDPDDTLPLRGGIDLALGTLLQPENFLYSPALTRAYDLESTKAVYARTVAGQRLIEFLNSHVEAEGSSPEIEFQRALATHIRNMFFQDDLDRAVVLDFLGDSMRKTLGRDRERAQQLASRAWIYVQRAYEQKAAAGDDYVADKYAWLVEYMKPRLPAWGVIE